MGKRNNSTSTHYRRFTPARLAKLMYEMTKQVLDRQSDSLGGYIILPKIPQYFASLNKMFGTHDSQLIREARRELVKLGIIEEDRVARVPGLKNISRETSGVGMCIRLKNQSKATEFMSTYENNAGKIIENLNCPLVKKRISKKKTDWTSSRSGYADDFKKLLLNALEEEAGNHSGGWFVWSDNQYFDTNSKIPIKSFVRRKLEDHGLIEASFLQNIEPEFRNNFQCYQTALLIRLKPGQQIKSEFEECEEVSDVENLTRKDLSDFAGLFAGSHRKLSEKLNKEQTAMILAGVKEIVTGLIPNSLLENEFDQKVINLEEKNAALEQSLSKLEEELTNFRTASEKLDLVIDRQHELIIDLGDKGKEIESVPGQPGDESETKDSGQAENVKKLERELVRLGQEIGSQNDRLIGLLDQLEARNQEIKDLKVAKKVAEERIAILEMELSGRPDSTLTVLTAEFKARTAAAIQQKLAVPVQN